MPRLGSSCHGFPPSPLPPRSSSPALPSERHAPETAEEFFAKGVARHQAGDILGAIEAYRSALEKEPGRVDARSNLGAAYVRLGRYQDAVEQYRKALEAEPQQSNVRFNLALALYKSALVNEAAAELEKVVAQDAGNTSALLLLADCQLQLGQDAQVSWPCSRPTTRAWAGTGSTPTSSAAPFSVATSSLRGQALIDRCSGAATPPRGGCSWPLPTCGAPMPRAPCRSAQRAVELNPELPTVHSLAAAP